MKIAEKDRKMETMEFDLYSIVEAIHVSSWSLATKIGVIHVQRNGP